MTIQNIFFFSLKEFFCLKAIGARHCVRKSKDFRVNGGLKAINFLKGL